MLVPSPHGFPRCHSLVPGVDYLLLPDNEALSSDLYATPAGAHGALVPVVRRMTVVRATSAPQLCFGQSEAEAQLAGAAAPGAPGQRPLAPAGGKPGKRPRAAQQQQAQQATAEQPHAAAPPPPPQQQPESGKKVGGLMGRVGNVPSVCKGPAAALQPFVPRLAQHVVTTCSVLFSLPPICRRRRKSGERARRRLPPAFPRQQRRRRQQQRRRRRQRRQRRLAQRRRRKRCEARRGSPNHTVQQQPWSTWSGLRWQAMSFDPIPRLLGSDFWLR